MQQVLIVGGGLSGLALANLLAAHSISYTLLEGRNRWGGRILTKTEGKTPLEAGATWHWQYHTHLRTWLQKLGLKRFPQYQKGMARYEADPQSPTISFAIPPQEDSYRIEGGTDQLIQALCHSLNQDHTHLNSTVTELTYTGEHWEAITKDSQSFKAEYVISTLPPMLLEQTIAMQPALPKAVQRIMAETHTWMGDSIKYAVEYPSSFWREQGWAGAGFSQAGPATEVHDHSNVEGSGYALKGFLSPAIRALPRNQWQAALLQQLVRMYGPLAGQPSQALIYDWSTEPLTYQPGADVMPHQHQGHSIYQRGYLDDTFWLAGAETSPHYPGYMEGALASAEQVANQIREVINQKTKA